MGQADRALALEATSWPAANVLTNDRYPLARPKQLPYQQGKF
jgi:hypothetical protein